MTIKSNLATYMKLFPGSFVGFFDTVADILQTLGEDWNEYGSKKWGEVFVSSATQIRHISKNLSSIKDEYEAEETKKEAAKPTDITDIISDYSKKILAKIK